MKLFKAKEKQIVVPKLGDTKEKVWFALFPRKIEDHWIWLENFVSNYEFKKVLVYYEHEVEEGIIFSKYQCGYHHVEKWEIVDRYLIKTTN